MVLADKLYHITHTLPPSGYEPIYVWLTGVASSTFGGLAMVIIYLLARRVAKPRSALVAAVVAGLASPLLYYQFREVFYSHTASTLIIALVLTTWWPSGSQKDLALGKAAAIGAMTGLAMLVRWQHVIYLILPLYTALKETLCDGHRRWLRVTPDYHCT
jgi:asparagine N-glycosylation enzyme membrane subunit Stt3